MVWGVSLLLAAGVGVLAGAPAGAAAQASSVGQHVKTGSTWTFAIIGEDCELQTFGAGKTWTADLGGDGGRYSGGAATIKEQWTTGGDNPAVFKGTYESSAKEYKGKFKNLDGSFKAVLVKGDVDGC
jgi:hypothetical protein